MEKKLADNLLCHSFSFDGKLLAISNATSKITILSTESKKSSDWKKVAVLEGHDGIVSSLAFHPSSYLLVSCSHDRNAYVWTPSTSDNKEWDHKLVITKLDRAALHVSWSPFGDRFAISSCSKVVSVCTYDKANNWWSSSLIRKHRSSVIKVVWHPSGILLATASTDYRVRLCSAYKPRLDSATLSKLQGPPAIGDEKDAAYYLQKLSPTLLEKLSTFGEVLGYVDTGDKSWLDNVAFNQEGDKLLFSSNDKKLILANLDEDNLTINDGKMNYNESDCLKKNKLNILRDIAFLNDSHFVGAGYDNVPILFKIKRSEGSFEVEIEKELKPLKKIKNKKETDFERNTNKLEASLSYNLTKEEFDKLKISNNRHSSTIVQIEKNAVDSNKFSTCGLDGRVLLWNLEDYGIKI